MSSTICIRCHRPLSNPSSIEADMGPTCHAKAEVENRRDPQGRLIPRFNYAVIDQNEHRVLIKDLGPWNKFMTVTNAAEWVVAELAEMLNGRELYYIDSEGDTDQLLVVNGKFAGFKFIDNARAVAA